MANLDSVQVAPRVVDPMELLTILPFFNAYQNKDFLLTFAKKK